MRDATLCRLIIFFLIILFVSCGLHTKSSKEKFENFNYQMNQDKDYVQHLESLAYDYLNTPGIKFVKLSKNNIRYLRDIYNKITRNNELLLKKNFDPKFYVVKDPVPFFFSLPKGHFFFSLGLIKKYIKYEELLISVLTFEVIKTHLSLYKKTIIVPVGHITTERLLSLVRIPLSVKKEINKWTFYAMKRAGFDAYAYLNWLQTQNKNTLDFTLQLGDSQNISREEYMFKNFIVKQGMIVKDYKKYETNSSSDFYKLINYLNKINL